MRFAELLAGNIKTHILYAVRADNDIDTAAPHSRPAFRSFGTARGRVVRQSKPGMSLAINADGVKISLALPPLAREILARIDGGAA